MWEIIKPIRVHAQTLTTTTTQGRGALSVSRLLSEQPSGDNRVLNLNALRLNPRLTANRYAHRTSLRSDE